MRRRFVILRRVVVGIAVSCVALLFVYIQLFTGTRYEEYGWPFAYSEFDPYSHKIRRSPNSPFAMNRAEIKLWAIAANAVIGMLIVVSSAATLNRLLPPRRISLRQLLLLCACACVALACVRDEGPIAIDSLNDWHPAAVFWDQPDIYQARYDTKNLAGRRQLIDAYFRAREWPRHALNLTIAVVMALALFALSVSTQTQRILQRCQDAVRFAMNHIR